MPRTLATFQRGLPVGVATPRSVSRLASWYKVACGARYQSNSCATSTASLGSTRTPAAWRGRSGSRRYPNGGVVHGSSVPARSLACRPRRIRSAISVRSYSATAPRISQQQLVVGVLAHRPVQELHLAAMPAEFVDEQHLVDVVTGQPVGRGDHDQVKLGQRGMVPQPVQTRAAKAGAAVAVVAVDVLVTQCPATLGHRGTQPVKLLLDGLRLGLAGGRDPRIDRRAHQAPPRRSTPARAGRLARPSAPAAGRPDPTGARRRDAGWVGGGRSRSGSLGSPTRTASVWRADRRKRSGRCHQVKLSRTRRTQQNLPFVMRPSSTTTANSRTAWGLTTFEGRSFGGWHHHVTLVSVAQ